MKLPADILMKIGNHKEEEKLARIEISSLTKDEIEDIAVIGIMLIRWLTVYSLFTIKRF